ncbi:MAG: peptidylprolyl isomerase [Methanoregula sp.]|uniref:FKBP-type peptidyl-prolyl cis-trans isomerase n=1 Tax=Methanoregula sp. TaxID=2052170 RepID=UPI003C191463
MKKSEKLKGKEKVAARRQQYKWMGVAAVVAIIIVCVAVYFVVYNPLVVAAAGDTVNVTYTGMFENKTVFDSNVNTTPLTFTIGSGKMIPGFDAAVRGMKVNEEKTVTIPYDQAYGAYNPQLVQTVPASKFPANQTISPGEKFYFQSSVDGRTTVVTVVNVTSSGVAVDANSPLAGQNLTFDIKIDSIQKGSSGSTATGTT